MAREYRFDGGVHPADGKAMSHQVAIAPAPLFERYVVPLQQHIGAPPTLVVKKGDKVHRGQLLAKPGGFVSAAIHSPTSGNVKALADVMGPAGVRIPAVEIIADGEDTPTDSLPPIADWQNAPADMLKARIADAGIVGMGGAGFPCAVKVSPPPAKPVDVLILNGVECEPCLTADHRLMLESAQRILTGARILARILEAEHVFLGVEANKPDAVAAMTAEAVACNVRVESLPVMYPQGAEKQLIYALTGRKVPTGGLPMDVGVVVQNVATCAAVADAVLEGKPLYERVTTVTGTPVAHPGNWVFRVGTPLEDALACAGGTDGPTGKLILGGPMMGLSVYSLEIPIMKATSGILLLSPREVHQFEPRACIRCGRCLDACPMKLMPGTLSVQIEHERVDLAERWHATDCIECGACAYSCPSHRPLVQHMRRAKGEIMAKRRAERAAKK